MIIRSTGFLPLFLTISLASCSYTLALQLGLSSSNERSALLYCSEMPIRGLKGLRVERLSNAHQLLCFNLVIEGPFLKLSSWVSIRFNIWSTRTRPIYTIAPYCISSTLLFAAFCLDCAGNRAFTLLPPICFSFPSSIHRKLQLTSISSTATATRSSHLRLINEHIFASPSLSGDKHRRRRRVQRQILNFLLLFHDVRASVVLC